MRAIKVQITCDSCLEDFDEKNFKGRELTITVSGTKKTYRQDLCATCFGDWLDSVSPTAKSPVEPEGEVLGEFWHCEPCSKFFKTARGLQAHTTRQHKTKGKKRSLTGKEL